MDYFIDNYIDNYKFLFKILLVGNSSTGKTTLLMRYTDNIFTTEYSSTIGVDFKIKSIMVDDDIIKLQIWDTAGQERFKSIVKSYYRNSNGVLLVFSLTDIESFNSIENWLNDIKDYCIENIPVIIIGTKSDLKNEIVVTDDMIQSLKSLNYFKNRKLIYYKISSLLDNVNFLDLESLKISNIYNAFLELTNEIKDNININEKYKLKVLRNSKQHINMNNLNIINTIDTINENIETSSCCFNKYKNNISYKPLTFKPLNL